MQTRDRFTCSFSATALAARGAFSRLNNLLALLLVVVVIIHNEVRAL